MNPPAAVIGIVDDDASICTSLSRLIRSARYRSAMFPSAEALLSSGQLPDIGCLILDQQLPGLSGLELQRRLSSSESLIPVIFVTAHSERIGDCAIRQGAVAVFDKPFSGEALLWAIAAGLAARPYPHGMF